MILPVMNTSVETLSSLADLPGIYSSGTWNQRGRFPKSKCFLLFVNIRNYCSQIWYINYINQGCRFGWIVYWFCMFLKGFLQGCGSFLGLCVTFTFRLSPQYWTPCSRWWLLAFSVAHIFQALGSCFVTGNGVKLGSSCRNNTSPTMSCNYSTVSLC